MQGCQKKSHVLAPFIRFAASHSYTFSRRSGVGNFDLSIILVWLAAATPVVIGGAGGYLFYRLVGCKTGSCPITSSPWLSTIYGAVLGFLFAAR
jgi:hypothetical protein